MHIDMAALRCVNPGNRGWGSVRCAGLLFVISIIAGCGNSSTSSGGASCDDYEVRSLDAVMVKSGNLTVCGVSARVKNDNDHLYCPGFTMIVRALDESGEGFAHTIIVGSPFSGNTETFTEPFFYSYPEGYPDCGRVASLAYEINPIQ